MKRFTSSLLVFALVASMGVLHGVAFADGPGDVGGATPASESTEAVTANSPASETTTDNGDGTFTFVQQVDEHSTPPHYTGPWSSHGGYGFENYSWYDQDYGWLHTFPAFSQPGLTILSATLTIRAWDVDSEPFHGSDGEYDGISGDGSWLNPQYLQGFDNSWSVTVFDVDAGALLDGEIGVYIDIDMNHTTQYWATTLDYSVLTVQYETSGVANNPPFQPTLSRSPAGAVSTTDDLSVTVTGPTPADPDGDTVTYSYRWLVDPGTGFFVDDDFAGRGNYTTSTVPSTATSNGDRWMVEVTPVDEHGAAGTKNSIAFATVGSGFAPPIADAGPDQTVPPGPVTLDGSASSDPDGTIVAWLWELWTGSAWGSIGTSAIITHDFGTTGTYSVRLTVTDSQELTDDALTYVTVALPTPTPTPVPALTWVGLVALGGLLPVAFAWRLRQKAAARRP